MINVQTKSLCILLMLVQCLDEDRYSDVCSELCYNMVLHSFDRLLIWVMSEASSFGFYLMQLRLGEIHS